MPKARSWATDFSSWPTDEVLGTIFGVKSEWNPEIEELLTRLRTLCKERATVPEALAVFRELAGRGSRRLRAACRGIAGAHACPEFRSAMPTVDPPSAEGTSESYESLSAMGKIGPIIDRSL